MSAKDNVLALKAKLSEAIAVLSSNQQLDDRLVKQHLTRVAMAILNEDTTLELIKLKIKNKSYIKILQDYLGGKLKMSARFILIKYNETDARLFDRINTLAKACDKGIEALMSVNINPTLYQELLSAIHFNLLEEASDKFDEYLNDDLSANQAIRKLLIQSNFVNQAFKNHFIKNDKALLQLWSNKRDFQYFSYKESQKAA